MIGQSAQKAATYRQRARLDWLEKFSRRQFKRLDRNHEERIARIAAAQWDHERDELELLESRKA